MIPEMADESAGLEKSGMAAEASSEEYSTDIIRLQNRGDCFAKEMPRGLRHLLDSCIECLTNVELACSRCRPKITLGKSAGKLKGR